MPKKNDDPSLRSAAYEAMCPRWELISALLGGTEAMTAAGDLFLPRHDKETQANYDDRLASTVLYNMFEETLASLTGRPFSAPIAVGDDVPAQVEALLDNIDLQGNKLDIFAQNWFQTGFAKGFCSVLVDFPTVGEDVKTKEDQARAKLRPYWVQIHPEQIIAARSELQNGVEVLTHVRIAETEVTADGFADVVTERIRVLEPGTVQLWEKRETKGGTIRWIPGDKLITKLDYIPLVTYYASPRDDLFMCRPPLMGLAELNRTHWQSTSDQRNILTVCRFPLLGASGVTKDTKEPLVIGPKKILYSPNPAGKYYYIEHTGAAIKQGADDLKALEEQMAAYGAEFLRNKPGSQTATEKALNTSASMSKLHATVMKFNDALNQTLAFTADWLGLGQDGGTVTVNTEWSTELNTKPENLATLREARKAKDISREQYLAQLKELGVLSEDFDTEANATELAEETIVLTAQELTALLALEQGDQISFTELRALLKRAGVATEEDEDVKDEGEARMKTGPGVQGTGAFLPGRQAQGSGEGEDNSDEGNGAADAGAPRGETQGI